MPGFVRSANQPVGNAEIQLYAAGEGSSTSSSSLLTQHVYSRADGSFNVPENLVCPSKSSQVYLVATGGGIASANNGNDASALVTSLGNCGDLATLGTVEADELTTVAFITALAPYMQSVQSVGAGSASAQNLSDAFLAAQGLASVLEQVTTSPTLPQGQSPFLQKLVTLADILSSCIDSADGSACGRLFSSASTAGGVAPADTTSALLAIANNPEHNVTSIYSLRPANAPFQPVLSSAPDDWSLAATAAAAPQAPVFSPTPGTYTGTQNITLTDNVSGAYMAYYLGGSWKLYGGAFSLQSSATVYAIAYSTALSPVTSGAYTITNPVISVGVSGSVAAGQTATGSVSLSAAAPQGGAVITLASSAPAVAAISPASVTIPQGQTSASFSCKGISTGSATISASAAGLNTATAPVTVTATVGITLAPGSATLNPSQTQQFTASITGTPNTAVTWSLSPSLGSISSSGLYTAPATISSSQNITVTATSAANPSKQASATVALSAPATPAPPTPAPAPPAPTPTSVPSGIVVNPGDNVASIVAAAPAGSTFHLTSGVYRMQQIVPQTGDTFIGDSGADLTGATVLTNFSNVGGLWVTPFTGTAGQQNGSCLSSSPACIYPEDLFFDNVPVQRVASLSALVAGTWYLDYVGGKVYVFNPPAGHTVELSMSRSAFRGSATNVTIQNLIVEKYAVPAQMGAIGDQNPGTGWKVINTQARLNHGAGIRVVDSGLIQDCTASNNGQEGISANGAGIIISSNTISNNNYAGFDPGWEAGGLKTASTTNLLVSGNTANANNGPGLWADINSSNTIYSNNIVTNNTGEGIKYEISYGATITGNTVSTNGSSLYAWLWGAQILIQNSSNVTVTNNTVIVGPSFGNGIGIVYQNRGTGTQGPYNSENNTVQNNTVTYQGTQGQSGFAADYNQLTAVAWPNTFNNDVYHVSNITTPHWTWNQNYTFSQFQQAGHDQQGSIVVGN